MRKINRVGKTIISVIRDSLRGVEKLPKEYDGFNIQRDLDIHMESFM